VGNVSISRVPWDRFIQNTMVLRNTLLLYIVLVNVLRETISYSCSGTSERPPDIEACRGTYQYIGVARVQMLPGCMLGHGCA